MRSSTTTSSSTRRPRRWCSRSSSSSRTTRRSNIVIALATFGVGYVARPIGAFVLGHWGDKHGRKTVLVLCMMMMGLSTFFVALLPTYAAIGIWAPILLVALRLIQGFAVGGEIAGAGSMIMEHSPFGRRGYFASFTLQGVQAGQILAAAVFLPLACDTAGRGLPKLGLADPVPAQRGRGSCGHHHPSTGRRDAGVQGGGSPRRGAAGADRAWRSRRMAATCSG